MNEESTAIEKIVTWGILAGFGGAVKYISAVIRTNEAVSNRRFVWLLAANMFISCFCGLMGGLLVKTLTQDQTWQYLACGLIGYMGTQGLDLVMLALKKKIDPVSSVVSVPPSTDPAASPK